MAPLTPKLRLLRNCPLCIICARAAEAEGIAKALGIQQNRVSGHEVLKVNNAYTFYLGAFTLSSGEELQYYVTSGLRQGIQSFTVNASILFGILRPRFVIHAGVCAGYFDPNSKVNMEIGDVIFGEAATNYQEGKTEVINNKVLFRPDYNTVTYPAGNLQAFAEAPSRPRYHYGDYVSGSSVRTDAGDILRKIREEVNRRVIALDMEASAFLQLCQHFGDDQAIPLGVVKGISDFGDPAKGTVEHAYEHALENTAHAIKSWVTHRITAITWTVDESEEPGAKLVPGYYDNFVRKVLDNFISGWPVTDKSDPSVVIPSEQIKGLKTVLPKGNSPKHVQEWHHVQSTVNRYQIREVQVGGRGAARFLHYKAGYLIDWSRNTNSLTICEDGEYQVQVFGRLLSKRPFYVPSDDTPPLASVVSWEDTLLWLKQVEQEEGEEKRKAKTPDPPQKQHEKRHITTQDEEEDMRPSRQQGRQVPNGPTIFGEGRHESPTPIEKTSTVTSRDASNGRATKQSSHTTLPKSSKSPFTWNPRRARSKEAHTQERSTTLSPKRPGSREPKTTGRSESLSPRRSITRLLHAFRKSSSSHDHETVVPLPPTNSA